MKKIAIYGAQGIALGTYYSIRQLHKDWDVIGFLVTSKDNNPDELEQIPVVEFYEFARNITDDCRKEITILIATPEDVMADIEVCLKEEKLNYERIDSIRWADEQDSMYRVNKEFVLVNDLTVSSLEPINAEALIYVAKHHRDKMLSTSVESRPFYRTIQVGAANTDIRVSTTIDCTGDNISSKNCDYSELTALYWVWRNMINKETNPDKYYGLCHYRRFLMIDEAEIEKMAANNIDVVLPHPLPYYPNSSQHHKRYLSDKEWEAVLLAIKELYPEYYESAIETMNRKYIFNYNIMIAKASVYSGYCEWLFSILFKVETIVSSKGLDKHNRYMGYISETLETIYFMHNWNGLNVALSGCRFFV